ncbi:MAG: 5-oxoprolinase subunit PxpB [Flavobacteriaceae bacterium]
MRGEDFTISIYNKHSILIQFHFEIDENNVDLLLFYKRIILEKHPQLILQVINTYNSLLVIYVTTINKIYRQKESLKSLILNRQSIPDIQSRILEIPVCYHEEFGLDLDLISKENNLEISDISKLHSAKKYRVFFIGFLPGFPYLSHVDSRLEINRKKEPRAAIEKGSVGIAGLQTGIYPESSPAGWQIIGRTPLQLFDEVKRQSLLKAGDYLKFKPIDKKQFEEIEERVFHDAYTVKIK